MASVVPFPEAARESPPARAKLRVGVFAAPPVERFILEALAAVASSTVAELTLVCERGQTPVSRIGENRGLTPVSRMAEKWGLTPLVAPGRRMPLEVGNAEWRERVREHELDVAFVAGDVEVAALEGLARFGTWRYAFGEDHSIGERDAGRREVFEGAPVTASGIRVRLGQGRPDRVACRSWSRTQPFSVARNRGNVFAKASDFLLRALRDLAEGGPEWLDSAPEIQQGRGYLPVDLGDRLRLAARIARRAAQKAAFVEQWTLAWRFTDIEPWSGALDGFFRLDPPKDRFYADPFPLQHQGRSYIFFEELPFAAGKAHISVVEVDREGRASEPMRVLERDYHLSYPFLVEDGGELYMIPETGQNRTVEIYRCVEFPARWKRERVLLDGLFAVDATLHREADRWWMFANVANPGAEIHDELCLFGAESLLGPWSPHPRNPVKSDVRNARPAGRLFTQGGKLYRPAQVCAPLYGSGVAMNRVTRLDARAFEEEEERRILPAEASGVIGLHTVNRAGSLSVIDAFVRRPRFSR
ncbi:MAG TPA: hypothetical protein VN598_19115 [Usitatibacter sp.]|nr:hypothetical protein [Usitatibacter sp.]